MIYLIIGIVAQLLILWVFLALLFRIKRQLWNQQQTINLLLIIAGKLGASGEELDLIKTKNNGVSDQYL